MYLGWQGMAQTSSDPSKHIGQLSSPHLNLSSHYCHRVVSTQRMLAHAQTASCKPPDGSGCFPREPLGHEAVMPGASRHDCCDDCYGLHHHRQFLVSTKSRGNYVIPAETKRPTPALASVLRQARALGFKDACFPLHYSLYI